ncbi:hypothetical protein MMC16_001343 [Acarospora aff. strigata]|nr:hypothetical protein [Acarospora aff. strigata]
MSSQPNLHSTLTTHLINTKSLPPSPAWLSTFLSTQKPTTPLPSLQQTLLFRLLASDLTSSLDPSHPNLCFPSDVHDPNVRERRLRGPVAVQVLGVEDMGRSRWEQVEAMEAVERGEGTKGREIIRVAPGETGDDGGERKTVGAAVGPHKLLVQDARGMRVYAIELVRVAGVGVGMSIGCKIVLRDVVVARGVVLLEPMSTSLLGGKIEGLHRAWRENRKAELKAAIRGAG